MKAVTKSSSGEDQLFGAMSIKDIINRPGFIENAMRRRQLRSGFLHHEDIKDKWGYIREAYKEAMPQIMAAAQRSPSIWSSPYILDWSTHLNKFEWACWEEIRLNGGIVLYPQFPLFNYFIDFAHPGLRIGLELDGNQHQQEKDRERDEHLGSHQWRIFRAPVKMVFSKHNRPEELAEEPNERELQQIENWMLHSISGLLEAMRIFYFTTSGQKRFLREHRTAVFESARRTLEIHRWADFPLED